MAGVKTFIVLLALCGGAGFFLYKALFPSIPERDWTQFDVPESDAVVEMPGTPSARALALPPDAPMIGGLWHLERPREHFTFGVVSVKRTDGKQFTMEEFGKISQSVRDKLKTTLGGVTITERDIALGENPGREYQFFDGTREGCLLRIYLVTEAGGTHVYGLYAAGPYLRADAGAGGRFLDSFKLVPRKPLTRAAPALPGRAWRVQ